MPQEILFICPKKMFGFPIFGASSYLTSSSSYEECVLAQTLAPICQFHYSKSCENLGEGKTQ